MTKKNKFKDFFGFYFVPYYKREAVEYFLKKNYFIMCYAKDEDYFGFLLLSGATIPQY